MHRSTAKSWLSRLVLVRVAGLRLDSKRLPEGEKKQLLLGGIARATRILPRSVSCPRTRPTQLASGEVHAMRDLVTSVTSLNYSRKLIAWELATKLDPSTTCRVLEAAGAHLPSCRTRTR